MTRSARLAVVIDMARKNEEQAAKKLEQCRQSYQAHHQRLEELNNYYHDYDMRFKQNIQGVRANDFAAKRFFLGQLSTLIDQQKNTLNQVEITLEKARQEWQQCHLKSENLQRFVADLKRGEVQIADKIEQYKIDEWVTQNYKPR